MDINKAIDLFLEEIRSFRSEYEDMTKGLTSANKESAQKEFQDKFLKKHNITTEKRGTLSVPYYIKQYSGTIKLTVRDVSKQFTNNKVILFNHKKEVRRIDTLYKYNNKNICIDIWTSDITKADQLKVGSAIELTGDFEISYYKYDGDETVNISYKGSKPDFTIVSI
ncbi:MAG: hypothetical protein IJ224_06665 [Lachnospiraceae bacterium]|nr:hypothetical protein [Lachnospiraceae bacterium]